MAQEAAPAQTSPQNSQSSSPAANASTGFTPEDYSAIKEELSSTKAAAERAQETVNRLKTALSPEEKGSEKDPNEAFLDYYLQQSLEAEKAGAPIPLTTNLAVKLFETQKQLSEAMKVINDLKGKTDSAVDPVAQMERQTYAALDNLLQDQLYSTYGRENVSPERFTAVASEISNEIRRLKSDSPDVWEDVRRSGRAQKALVDHFVSKSVPPAARRLIEQEQIRNYKMTSNDLMQAFREANEVKDPDQRAKVKARIRQDLWAEKWEGNRRPRRG